MFISGIPILTDAFMQTRFCFVPAVSALAINSWQTYLNSTLNSYNFVSLGQTGFNGYNIFPAANELHIRLNNAVDFIRQELEYCPYLNNAYSVQGSKLICSGSPFSVNGLPSGCFTAWNTSTNIGLTSIDSYNKATFRSLSSGSGWIEATIYSNCSSLTLPRVTIWSGELPNPVVSGPTTAKCGYTLTYQVDQTNRNYATSFYWDSDILALASNNNSSCQASAGEGGSGQISCRVTGCSTKSGSKSISAIPCPRIAIYPNPASDNVEISLNTGIDELDLSSLSTSEFVGEEKSQLTIRILNSYGTKVYSSEKAYGTFVLSTSALKNGTYIVEISDGKNVYREQLIVKH